MHFPLILAQIQTEKTIAPQTGFFHLVLSSDPVVKVALLVLIFFSVVSWAIILYKQRQVKQAQKDVQNFWSVFAKSHSISEVLDAHPPRQGPLFSIFNTAVELLARFKKGGAGSLKNELLRQKLIQARETEIYKLEQYTPFLATTASTAPFVGLFGTVWGILTAFWAIGKAGSSSLATVGPFISEALVATAIGLAAAIPAVIAYNHFVHRIKILTKMIDLFLEELSIKIEEESA